MAMQQNYNIITNSSSKSKSQRNKNLRLAKKWIYFENKILALTSKFIKKKSETMFLAPSFKLFQRLLGYEI